jgi:hypothetical protein
MIMRRFARFERYGKALATGLEAVQYHLSYQYQVTSSGMPPVPASESFILLVKVYS